MFTTGLYFDGISQGYMYVTTSSIPKMNDYTILAGPKKGGSGAFSYNSHRAERCRLIKAGSLDELRVTYPELFI